MHNRIPINIKNNNLLYISSTQIDDTFQTTIHSHPNLEILLIIEGKGTLKTTNHQIKISAGDLIFINPNYNHEEFSNNLLKFYAIGLNKIAAFSLEKITKNYIIYHTKKDDFESLRSFYNLIYREASNKENSYEKLIELATNSLLIYFSRINNLSLSKNNSNDNDLIKNIKFIIDNNYSTNINLDEIATRLLVSKSTICHEFKSQVGESIIEYKINKQLEEAKNLLEITDMNISEIAYLVGFNNVSYFNKKFKERFLKNPKIYRKTLIK